MTPSLTSPSPPESSAIPSWPASTPIPASAGSANDYYLVNSSFCYFPGIPIFHSRDLVHWTQLGHVITRAAQANFDGLGVSRGVFAPALSYHDGTFYLVTTLVDCGGNCCSPRRTPAGRGPIPSGSNTTASTLRCSLTTTAYEGHRAIWLQNSTRSPAAHRSAHPGRQRGHRSQKASVWIEAPHLFRRGPYHYLICAEGGTAGNHSEVVFRSHGVRGPWEPFAGNPDPHAAGPARGPAPAHHEHRTCRFCDDARRRMVGRLPRLPSLRGRAL